MKVLLVDDRKETTDDLASLIRRRIQGEVKVAYKGDDAIRLASEFMPDVVVLDIELPVLNGFEVLEELKKREIDTRVIMLSGAYTEAEHIVRCIRAGACDFLKKPASVDAIVHSIERHYVLDNADNLRLYAEAPNLIKQLIDRTDYEERRTRNAEVDKLMDRVTNAERELGEMKIAKIELDAMIKLRDLTIARMEAAPSTKAEPVQEKINSWWNKISPNERAAYIGLIGICMAGMFTFEIAVYNKSTSDNKPKPTETITHSATPSAIPSVTPLALPPTTPDPSIQYKDLNLSLEEYADKVSSFGNRLGLQADYVKSVEGDRVTWQGTVERTNVAKTKFASVAIRSEKKPTQYSVVIGFFDQSNQILLDRIYTLQVGDLVKISGFLDTEHGTGINADKLEVIRPAGNPTP